jgi:hypothetical protein
MRPLADDDLTIARLSDGERRAVAEVWAGRAAAERTAAESFAVIGDDLAAVGAPAELIALARRAVDDELRHAELCRRVASAYRGAPLPPPAPLPLRVPVHAGAAPEVRRALHVVGMCCLNETTGSAFLEACLAEAHAPLARAALRALLSDEIDHARIGWGFLSSAASLRPAIAAWVPSLLEGNRRAWRERLRTGGGALAAHGCPTAARVDAALEGAERDLILPGLRRAGLLA